MKPKKSIHSIERTLALTIAPMIFSVAISMIFLSGNLMAQENSSVTETTPAQNNSSSSAGSSQDNGSGYQVKSSVEVGVRGVEVNGDREKYRSDLNYGAGVRLFDSSLLITAEDSKDKAFDTLLITGSGWNADPNGYARMNVEKTGWYRFDSTVRRFSYFNNLDNFALNEHTRNSKRNIGDFDITILPQNEKFRFRFGYSFNTNHGPATSTFDYDRDEFPLESEFNSRAHDFRFGADGKVLGFDWSITEGLRYFNDDTNFFIDTPQLGSNPSPNSSLATFIRNIPERGKTVYHSLNLHRTFAKRFDFTGRIIYSDSRSRFSMTEQLTGRDRSGNPITLDETTVSGDAKRPNTVGDIGITAYITKKFKVSNTFSVNSYRISGGNVLLEALRRTNAGGTPLPVSVTNSLAYRFTNYRRYINTFEGDYDVNRYFSVYLGYRYTNRRVTLNGLDINLLNQTSGTTGETAENTTNTVIGGFKASPILKKWVIFFDLERGEADNAFTRLGNYNLTNVRLRNRIKPTNNLSLNFSFQIKNNDNPSRSETVPATDFSAEVKSRIFAGSIDWQANDKVSLSGGYTYNYLNSETAIIFPVTGASGQGFSRYNLRSNFFHFDVWARPHPRVSFFGSYRITKDTTDGDFFSATDFLIEGSYPISFQSPEARLIFRINKHIDWNVGYQYYNYSEKLPNMQNYNAHLPYTSLRIYFGRNDR
ncbi:MAG: hypothetical protein R2747_12500 [Pyrinomonadaceae bacterium]